MNLSQATIHNHNRVNMSDTDKVHLLLAFAQGKIGAKACRNLVNVF